MNRGWDGGAYHVCCLGGVVGEREMDGHFVVGAVVRAHPRVVALGDANLTRDVQPRGLWIHPSAVTRLLEQQNGSTARVYSNGWSEDE